MAVVGVLIAPRPATAGLNTWTTAGLEGGDTTALAVDPQTKGVVYAASGAGGVFKSATDTTVWARINAGLPREAAVRALALDPQTPTTLYSGTDGAGVFKSTNGGASWSASNDGLTSFLSQYVWVVSIHPQRPTTLHAGTRDGVFKSTNSGASWSAGGIGLSALEVRALAIDPRIPTILYAGTQTAGVFKSTNDGATWSASNAGLATESVAALAIDPQTPTILYAGTNRDGVFKSTDGGTSWSTSNAGFPSALPINALALDPQTPAIIYAGTDGNGVFKSTNGGASWSASNDGLTGQYVNALIFDSRAPVTIYAGLKGNGVFKTTNGGAGWSPSNAGLNTNQVVTTLAIDPQTPSTLYAGTTRAGVFKSVNGGISWRPSSAGLTDPSIGSLASDPMTPGTLYAATGGIFKSTNGGVSWSPRNTSFTNLSVNVLAIDPQAPTTVYAGGVSVLHAQSVFFIGTVIKSTNGGATWTRSTDFLGTSIVSALAIDPQVPATLYAGNGNGVFKSTDGGLRWDMSSNGLDNRFVNALAIVVPTPTIIYAGTDDGVFKSTNGGATWSSAGLACRNVAALAIDPQTPATVYAGTEAGVFKSTDGGATWSASNSGLTGFAVNALLMNPRGTCLHAGTDNGPFAFATRVDGSCQPPPPLTANLFTTSQSVDVGTAARTFAVVENLSGTSSGSVPNAEADGVAAVTCGITQLTGARTTFTFQAVDPDTDQPIAPVNSPVDIGAASSQKFLVTVTPSAPVCPIDIQFGFNCTNTTHADIRTRVNTLLLTAGPTAACGLSVSATTNQETFAEGQTLVAGGSVTNSGLPGMAADFYVGVLRPDNSIQFRTPTGIVVGNIGDLRSFRPLAVSVPLASPFAVSESSVFTHQWTVDDQAGPYLFFTLAVKPGALAGGTITSDQILTLATAPYSFVGGADAPNCRSTTAGRTRERETKIMRMEWDRLPGARGSGGWRRQFVADPQ